LRYKTRDKTVEVGGSTRYGETIGPISFKTGSYSTTDPDEIAFLDELATSKDNPIGFDPKEAKEE